MNTQFAAADARLEPVRAAFRTLMIHVPSASTGSRLLETAVALARRLDATLFGVGAAAVDPALMGGLYDAALMVPELVAQVRGGLRHAEDDFNRAAEGVKHRWVALEQQPGLAMAKTARGADLILAGPNLSPDQGVYSACDAGELVVKSGRPVLVIPKHGGRLDAEVVLVAWRDSREARRALADSLPFLKSAREVVVMEICAKGDVDAAAARTAAVLEGLKPHGVQARATVLCGDPGDAAERLDLAAATAGADLIVAGGYGHSRLGEWVFGGVTRALLRDPQRFILMSH